MTALQQAKLKAKVLEELATNPIVEAACRKVSLPRSTYYRWRQSDEEFARTVDTALENGRDRINDMAESQLIKKIGGGDLPTIKFWLTNNSTRYGPKKAATPPQANQGRPIPLLENVLRVKHKPGESTTIEIEDD